MRLRHRTVRAPRQAGGQAGRQGASGSRGRQQKATGRPHRAARPPPGFAIAAAASTDSDDSSDWSSDEDQGEDDPDLQLLPDDASPGQQQQQQPAGMPAPPASTQRPAPSSEERWLTEMGLSPLLSLPQLGSETEAAGAWAAPSATPAALPAATPGLVAGVERSAALPSPAFHDFGGPSLPPRQPLWGSQPAPPTSATPAAGAATVAPGAVSVGAGRTVRRRVSSDGSGRAGLAAATAAVAREAARFAAGGAATSPPMHPWDLRRPASGPSPVQLHDVHQLQRPPAATPAKVPVLAGAANPQQYHLFACGAAVPFDLPPAPFGLPPTPRPVVEAPAGSTAQLPQPGRLALPASEAAAVAAVQAAFAAAAAAEPSPHSAFTATHYSAGSSLATRHAHHTPLSGGLGAAQPLERSQRSRRQRELSEEFHWSDEEEGEEEEGGGGSETETDEDDGDM